MRWKVTRCLKCKDEVMREENVGKDNFLIRRVLKKKIDKEELARKLRFKG